MEILHIRALCAYEKPTTGHIWLVRRQVTRVEDGINNPVTGVFAKRWMGENGGREGPEVAVGVTSQKYRGPGEDPLWSNP